MFKCSPSLPEDFFCLSFPVSVVVLLRSRLVDFTLVKSVCDLSYIKYLVLTDHNSRSNLDQRFNARAFLLWGCCFFQSKSIIIEDFLSKKSCDFNTNSRKCFNLAYIYLPEVYRRIRQFPTRSRNIISK